MRSGSEEDFDHLSKEPQYWLNKATALRSAAGSIWYCLEIAKPADIADAIGGETQIDFSSGSWQVYRMLCGMSLELLYKAIIVAQNDPVPASHNLLFLAEKAGCHVTRKNAGILELLTECIIWEGRYPVPKDHPKIEKFVFLHYENLFYKERTDNSVVLKPIEPNPLDWINYSELWKKAYVHFEFIHS